MGRLLARITQKKIGKAGPALRVADWLLLLYFGLLPLGQLMRGVYLADIVVGICGLYVLKTQKGLFSPDGKLLSVLLLLLVSFGISLGLFEPGQTIVGVGYALRLIAYLLFFYFVREHKPKIDSLFAVNLIILAAGFAQFFFLPDTRFLKSFGWDDHYFRLVGTFLDPAFMGIILLIFLIVAVAAKKYWLAGLNLLAIALTYSRATYLALVVALAYLFILTRRKIVLVFPIALLVLIPFLPRPSSEGVKLERTYSIWQRLESDRQGLILFAKSPVLGLGLNNLCAAKVKFFGETQTSSHSCGGTDNSFIFILATTGIVGLIFSIELLTKVPWRSEFGVILMAVLVHSQFTNTLFYSFVMGLLAITLAINDEQDYIQ